MNKIGITEENPNQETNQNQNERTCGSERGIESSSNEVE